MSKRRLLYIFLAFTALSCGQIESQQDLDAKAEIIDSVSQSKIREQVAELSTLYKPYNPEADAEADLAALIDSAKRSNKNILIQAGGNWCIWCLRFEKFRKDNPSIESAIADKYLFYHLNYSEENKNEKVLAQLGNPGKLGYPVFIVMSPNGKIIHTQGSEYLEEAEGYSEARVLEFLNKWSEL